MTGVMRWAGRRLGVVDPPSRRKLQPAPVPRMGGVAIFLSAALALWITYALSSEVRAKSPHDFEVILLVGAGIALVGLMDDVFSVPAILKLGVLAVGCLVLAWHGIGVNRTPIPAVNYVLTFLWVAGVASAFNAIDNADGLAGSVALTSALVLFVMGWSSWQVHFSFLAMAIAGAVLGFLHHNMSPARIYMGDCGSFFLGYILAVLVMYGDWCENPIRSFVAGCMVVAFPVYDLGVTTILRIRHGIVRTPLQAIAYSDRDHLSHRLLRLGMPHRRMLAILTGISGAFCLAGLYAVRAPGPALAGTVVLAVAFMVWFARDLNRRTSAPDLWVNRSTPHE